MSQDRPVPPDGDASDGPEPLGGTEIPPGPVSGRRMSPWAQEPPLRCRCGARFWGKAAAHCGVCHVTFRSVAGFDDHRTGPADTRRCRTEAEMRELGYEPDDRGVWRVPLTEATGGFWPGLDRPGPA